MKPTPVRDHQGAATPPADRAYLRDLSHAHMPVRVDVHIHARTYTTGLIRVNDSNVPRGGRWWIQEDTRRNGSPRLLPDSRTRVLPPRDRNGLRERTEEREGRRSNVDSIIVGSAPRFAPCKYPRQRDWTRRVLSRPSGYRIPGTGRSPRVQGGISNGGTFRAKVSLFFPLSSIAWETKAINYLALPIVAKMIQNYNLIIFQCISAVFEILINFPFLIELIISDRKNLHLLLL